MSINWVMLSPSSKPPYTPLQNEQHLFTSSPRVALSISRPSQQSYPGNRSRQQQQRSPQEQNFSITSSSGVLHLTNRRLIFLPDVQPSSTGPNQSTSLASSFFVNPFSSSSSAASPSASTSTPASTTSTSTLNSITSISSFAAPILSLHDSHVTAPWFGPNVWTALLQPTPGGGLPIPSTTGVLELKLTFKDGGAFDFHAKYEQLRERLQQVLETARSVGEVDGGGASNGVGGARTTTDASAVVAGNVHLDQLPAYAERGDGPLLPPVLPVQQQQQQPQPQQGGVRRVGGNTVNGATSTAGGNHVSTGRSAKEAEARRDEVCTPDEPPPAYEEAQLAGLQEEMERRRRDGEDEDEDDLPPR